MKTLPAPLVNTVNSLHTGLTDLMSHVEEMCGRVQNLDTQVEATLGLQFVAPTGWDEYLLAWGQMMADGISGVAKAAKDG